MLTHRQDILNSPRLEFAPTNPAWKVSAPKIRPGLHISITWTIVYIRRLGFYGYSDAHC